MIGCLQSGGRTRMSRAARPGSGRPKPGAIMTVAHLSCLPDGRRSVLLLAALTLPILSATPTFAADGTSASIVRSAVQITRTVARPGSAAPDFLNPVISGSGTRIAFRAQAAGSADTGLFLFDVPSGTLTQLTVGDAAGPPDLALGINYDGTRVAFSSNIDVTGGNGDRNSEIFLLDVATGTFIQITDTVGSGSITPVMNDDGTRIAFRSNADLT